MALHIISVRVREREGERPPSIREETDDHKYAAAGTSRSDRRLEWKIIKLFLLF